MNCLVHVKVPEAVEGRTRRLQSGLYGVAQGSCLGENDGVRSCRRWAVRQHSIRPASQLYGRVIASDRMRAILKT